MCKHSRCGWLPGLVVAVAVLSTAPSASSAWAGDSAFQVTQQPRGFIVRTARLEVTVRDGQIVAAKNLLTGEVHASEGADASVVLPAGLGHLSGQPNKAASLHSPWGSGPPPASFPTMHRACATSKYRATVTDSGVEATWTGLSDGRRQFDDESLTLSVWVDRDQGALCFSAAGRSPRGGVYGVQTPLANLHREHRIYVPSFGGMMLDADGPAKLTTLGGAPYWEAPVIALEGRKGSLGLWVEDAQFHPNFCFLTWTGKTFAAAIESLNLMPFEPHAKIDSITWRLDAFAGGWVAAMTPYKRWYTRAFAPELATRAAVKWADKIRVVIDQLEPDPAVRRQLASLCDPATVLIHEWSARAGGFAHDLPDWTPRATYRDQVRTLHALGFRTMAYVNTYCVDYNSPAFVRDRVADFGLTRRMENFFNYGKPLPDFSTASNGQEMYLDPLSPGWRAYHTAMMLRWRQETGTDANYEDTGGAVGDFGNGVVQGKFGAQGGTEQFRELLRRNPEVPMAAEYDPDAIAFAVRWPLRWQTVWGNDAGRIWWMAHQRPVSAYIHGPHRPWVPTVRAENALLRHVVLGCSDALGGLAQFPVDQASLQATSGILAQMIWRARLFSALRLEPEFPSEIWEPTLACRYRDLTGRHYRYYADEHMQRLVAEDGRELYARVTGVNRLKTGLTLPGWPAVRDGALLALDPNARYALVPGPSQRIRLSGVPEGAKITRCYETPRAAVLVLEPANGNAPKRGVCEFAPMSGFTQWLLNDAPRPASPTAPFSQSVDLPAYIVFLRGPGAKSGLGTYFSTDPAMLRRVEIGTGLERGGKVVVPPLQMVAVPGEKALVPFLFLNHGNDSELVLDYAVQVPSKDATLRVYVHNRQDRYGNGVVARLYVNGKLRHSETFGPPNWDTRIHAWSIPLGGLAGRTVLISLATDCRADDNADHLMWSAPKFIAAPAQSEEFLALATGAPGG